MGTARDVINIGAAEQRKRRVVGIVALAAAVALLVWLDLSHAGRWWRLGAFPLLWVGALGFLQARARTCVMYAARGELSLDEGPRCAASPADSQILTARSRTIVQQTTIVAALVTLAALALP
jgi:hypothetical protein